MKDDGEEEKSYRNNGLKGEHINKVCGIIDLLFEVIYGNSEGLHSKA